jgi:Ca2+-binding EF-hand superfamily protein
MGLSDLQKKKFNYLFDLHDTNRDGVLAENDMVGIADRLAAVKGFAKTSPEAQAFQQAFNAEWKELEAMADTNKDKVISRDEWLAYISKVVADPGEYERRVVPVADMIIALVDDDQDGKVTAANWDIFFKVYGVKTAAAEIFPKIDKAGTGKLDRGEILARLHEFFYASDANVGGNWFYGNL